MATYFVRMDSKVTGHTLAASRFEARDAAEARSRAYESFSRRLTPADVEGLPDDLAKRILETDAENGRRMDAGFVLHTRKVR